MARANCPGIYNPFCENVASSRRKSWGCLWTVIGLLLEPRMRSLVWSCPIAQRQLVPQELPYCPRNSYTMDIGRETSHRQEPAFFLDPQETSVRTGASSPRPLAAMPGPPIDVQQCAVHQQLRLEPFRIWDSVQLSRSHADAPRVFHPALRNSSIPRCSAIIRSQVPDRCPDGRLRRALCWTRQDFIHSIRNALSLGEYDMDLLKPHEPFKRVFWDGESPAEFRQKFQWIQEAKHKLNVAKSRQLNRVVDLIEEYPLALKRPVDPGQDVPPSNG